MLSLKFKQNDTELKNKVQLQNIKQNKINDTQKQARTIKSMGKLKKNERVRSVYMSGMEWGLYKIRAGMRKVKLE